MDYSLIKILQDRLRKDLNHPSPEGRFFSSDYISRNYRNLFGIGEDERFDKAFDIVAFGQGTEILKMNSLQSSSLLSLLFFYPLYGESNKVLIIENTPYNKCFFEIKNRVIKFPSCIDIVLWSEKKKKLLYLESKFSEYTDVTNKDEFSISYYSLYKKLKEKKILPEKFLLDTKEGNTKERNFTIQLTNNQKDYIQGIKQAISHIIGLINGPYKPSNNKNHKESKFLEEFNKHYYQQANEIEFSTILFRLNPEEGLGDFFKSYKNLYDSIIINKGKEIIATIKGLENWKGFHSDQEKGRLKIGNKIITYQDLSKQNPDYMQSLPLPIKQFYGL